MNAGKKPIGTAGWLTAAAALSLLVSACGPSQSVEEEEAAVVAAEAEEVAAAAEEETAAAATVSSDEEASGAGEETLVTSDEGFEITFPGPPEFEERELPEDLFSSWTYQQPDGPLWNVGHSLSLLEDTGSFGERGARAVSVSLLDGMIESLGGKTLKEDTELVFNGMPAASAEGVVERRGIKMPVSVLIATHPSTAETYLFMTLGTDDAQFETFVGSFRLLD